MKSGRKESTPYYEHMQNFRHNNLSLVNDQLDAQLLDFIIHLLQSYTRFEQHCAHHQEVKLY